MTVAMPLGLDTILATPRHDFSPLPEGDAVLEHFKRILALSGADLLRQARKLYRLA